MNSGMWRKELASSGGKKTLSISATEAAERGSAWTSCAASWAKLITFPRSARCRASGGPLAGRDFNLTTVKPRAMKSSSASVRPCSSGGAGRCKLPFANPTPGKRGARHRHAITQAWHRQTGKERPQSAAASVHASTAAGLGRKRIQRFVGRGCRGMFAIAGAGTDARLKSSGCSPTKSHGNPRGNKAVYLAQ